MVNKFKLTVVHCMPKPDADLRMRVDLPLDKKVGKIRTGAPGRRAIARRGPLGSRRPWAMGRWAVAGRGPRAAGLRACFKQNPPK